MKLTLFTLICLLLTACGNKFLNPADINVKAYQPAVQELIDRKELLLNILPGNDNVRTEMRTFEMRDFNVYKRLAKTFPKCYKLLREGKAMTIIYKADDCIWIILGIQQHTFTQDVECLKAGTSNNCDMFHKGDVKTKTELAPGWTYERVNEYTAD